MGASAVGLSSTPMNCSSFPCNFALPFTLVLPSGMRRQPVVLCCSTGTCSIPSISPSSSSCVLQLLNLNSIVTLVVEGEFSASSSSPSSVLVFLGGLAAAVSGNSTLCNFSLIFLLIVVVIFVTSDVAGAVAGPVWHLNWCSCGTKFVSVSSAREGSSRVCSC